MSLRAQINAKKPPPPPPWTKPVAVLPPAPLSTGKKCLIMAIICAVLLSLSAAVYGLCALSPSISSAMRIAALYISSAISFALSFSTRPFSELILVLLPLFIFLRLCFNLFKKSAAALALFAMRILCLLCAVVLIFVLTFGVHYSAPPLAEQLGITVGQYSTTQLYALLSQLAFDANEAAEQVARDDDNLMQTGQYTELSQAVMEAYERILPEYPSLAGVSDTPPKEGNMLGVFMSYVGIAGYYFPWTAEAVTSGDTVATHVAFNAAHEAAHARGIASESEANFVAYLVCSQSGDARLQYSAALNAFSYAASALNSVDSKLYAEVYATLSEQVLFDLQVRRLHSEKYQTPIRDVGTAVNDTFIKATGQPDGVRSYGMMVDLLLAYMYG